MKTKKGDGKVEKKGVPERGGKRRGEGRRGRNGCNSCYIQAERSRFRRRNVPKDERASSEGGEKRKNS